MWVRSQDKCRLVDVKGCYMFARWPFKQDQENYEFRIAGLMSEPSIEGCSWALGDYKTQEKALKVLDELQFLYPWCFLLFVSPPHIHSAAFRQHHFHMHLRCMVLPP